jgi:hypothetical protein
MNEEVLKDRIIVVCPNKDCGQKIGLPKSNEILHVTCPNPKCRTSFIYQSQPTSKTQPIPETQPISKKKNQWFINKIKNHPIFLGLILTIWVLFLINRFSRRTLNLSDGLFVTVACIILCFLGTWIIDKTKEPGIKWYYRKWFVILMLFLFAPLGITLLWAGSRFRNSTKIGLTISFGLLFIVGLLTEAPSRFYDTSKDQIKDLFSIQRKNIYLEPANPYAKMSFRNEILSGTISSTYSADSIFTIPEITKKWGGSTVLVKTMDKNGNDLSLGSGFVITKKGAIVTNYHVLESAHNVSIHFIGGKTYQNAFLIARYPSQDIAILYFDGTDEQFSPVILGNSDDLQVGERILAIGNPYGWENTLSDGLISGIREIDGFKLVQITAPVSPGSSGGPLFNMRGEVIGITTIGSQWGAQNLNFAIPINTLTSLIKENFQ